MFERHQLHLKREYEDSVERYERLSSAIELHQKTVLEEKVGSSNVS